MPTKNERDAVKRAEQYAPEPTGGSILAGLSGLVLAVLGVYLPGRFYGWPLQDHPLVAALVATLGFGVGFAGYKRAKMRSRDARAVERERGPDPV